jgi:hypothetical protein
MKMNGSAGMFYFREIFAKAESYKQLMSKSQKLQLAALKRKADMHDTFGNWQPLINQAFTIWEAALA